MKSQFKPQFISFLALLSLGFICCGKLIGQTNALDSLEKVYNERSFEAQDELSILKRLSRDLLDPQKKLKFSQLLKDRLIELDSTQYLYDALMQEGGSYRLRGDLAEALTSFLKASEIAQDTDSFRLVALSNITIGDVYSVMGNHENAVSYHEKGIAQLRALNRDSEDLATALLNSGDEYLNAGAYDKAMNLFLESSLIFKKLGNQVGSAYNLGNIGIVYANQGKTQLAEANINEAIMILEDEKDYYAISIYLNYVSDLYLDKNNFDQALKYSERSLELATKYQLKDEISKANLGLSTIYEQLDQSKLSLFHYKEYVRFKDSVNNLTNVQKLADLRTDFEIKKKQIEVDLINQEKENQGLISKVIAVVLIIVSILTYALFRRNKYINRTKKIIEEERQRSNNLLCNILPEETADELREKGSVKAKKYQSVTVLFSDFKGFTKYAEELPPEELVKTVDLYFSEFDRIMDKFDIEKIKTIGDAYMCASGLPVPRKDHAKQMVLAAQEMLAHVEHLKDVHAVDEARFDIRIGIHTGPIVAGVVGERKFAYDIWGDTVNVASRMESACEPGKINLSLATYELVRDHFNFESRGEIEIKNRAPVSMYYLKMNGQ